MNYTWKLKSLKKTNTRDIKDVVIQTYWEKIGTDEDGNTGIFIGATPFDISTIDTNNFISYDNLTEEVILGWIQSVTLSYEDHINSQIQKQIESKKNKIDTVDTVSDFPWSKP